MDIDTLKLYDENNNKKKKIKKKKKKDKFLIVCLIIFSLCIIGLVVYYLFFNGDKSAVKKKTPKAKITIVDEDSNKRPLAVMIDNNVGYDAHAGLQDSYINYEVIVEGGLTRIMALFKDKDVDLIGPVRSSRHYFLDYSSESDAIYCHYGWSDFAKNDMKTLNIDNINGMNDADAYHRDNKLTSPHNVFTSTDTLYKFAKDDKDYDVETDDWKLLNYSADEINFKGPKIDKETGEAKKEDTRTVANNVSLKYSNYQTTSYTYDSENKYYLRFMDGKEHIDKTTKKQLHYKNIIVEVVENYSLDSYGRQDLETVGDGEGYYITNGYALPITWSKESRTSKTIYKYTDGKKINFNDGNTFIQIVPTTTTPEFN